MRFQTSETIAVRDAEVVLRALESSLREMSGQVERTGDRITLRGLGPSPRAKNYRDLTVLCVNAEKDGTVIVADVSFQASSLLGDVRQDEVVRSKLDVIFDQMRTQLRVEKSERSAAVEDVEEEAKPFAGMVRVMERVRAEEMARAEKTASEPRLYEAEAVGIARETKAFAAETAEPVLQTRTESAEVRPGTAEPVRQVRAETSEPFLQMRTETEAPQRGNARWWWVAGLVIAALLLLEVGYVWRSGGWRSAEGTAGAMLQKASTWVAVLRDGSVKPPEGKDEVEKAPVEAPVALYAGATAEPKAWLENWAEAMRGRDPVAQASYYADRVDRYMTESNVSREVVVEKKREGIAGRRGEWTVKMEDVVVLWRTSSEAEVRLTKHFMDAPVPGEMTETRVRSKLHLRRVDGAWKIVREENLPDAGVSAGG